MTHSHTPVKCKKVLSSSIFRFNVTVFNFDSRTLATSRIFWSKINIFLIYVPKDSPCSCDHFHTNFLVVGSHLRRRNPEKYQKKRKQSDLCCGVINDVSLMNHISSKSTWSEVRQVWQTKCGDHVVALWSKMGKELKMALVR